MSGIHINLAWPAWDIHLSCMSLLPSVNLGFSMADCNTHWNLSVKRPTFSLARTKTIFHPIQLVKFLLHLHDAPFSMPVNGASTILIRPSHERYLDSNHRQLDWLINTLFRLVQTNVKYKSSASLVRCEGNPLILGGFSTRRTSNEGNFSCHGVIMILRSYQSVWPSPVTLSERVCDVKNWIFEHLSIQRMVYTTYGYHFYKLLDQHNNSMAAR